MQQHTISKLGWTISIPVTDSQDYDLIVDTGTKLLKVQVKTTAQVSEHGIYIVSLRTCGGNKSGHTAKTFDNNQIRFIVCINRQWRFVIQFLEMLLLLRIQLTQARKFLMYKVSLF